MWTIKYVYLPAVQTEVPDFMHSRFSWNKRCYLFCFGRSFIVNVWEINLYKNIPMFLLFLLPTSVLKKKRKKNISLNLNKFYLYLWWVNHRVFIPLLPVDLPFLSLYDVSIADFNIFIKFLKSSLSCILIFFHSSLMSHSSCVFPVIYSHDSNWNIMRH